jgi:hypothetical protein
MKTNKNEEWWREHFKKCRCKCHLNPEAILAGTVTYESHVCIVCIMGRLYTLNNMAS